MPFVTQGFYTFEFEFDLFKWETGVVYISKFLGKVIIIYAWIFLLLLQSVKSNLDSRERPRIVSFCKKKTRRDSNAGNVVASKAQRREASSIERQTRLC